MGLNWSCWGAWFDGLAHGAAAGFWWGRYKSARHWAVGWSWRWAAGHGDGLCAAHEVFYTRIADLV